LHCTCGAVTLCAWSGLGSDIGGSIRMPAFFCGIYGHKPTGGAVPGTGQFPMAEGDGCRHLATGPLCRFAEDLWPMLMVLAGPDGVDVGATPGIAARLRAREASPADVDMRRVTVYRVERLCAPALTAPVDPELLAAEARASEALCGRAGCTAAVLQLPEFADALNMWSAMLSLAVETTFRDNLESGGRVFMPLELVRAHARARRA
jgi:fatty acid amide hydrolase 2